MKKIKITTRETENAVKFRIAIGNNFNEYVYNPVNGNLVYSKIISNIKSLSETVNKVAEIDI